MPKILPFTDGTGEGVGEGITSVGVEEGITSVGVDEGIISIGVGEGITSGAGEGVAVGRSS